MQLNHHQQQVSSFFSHDKNRPLSTLSLNRRSQNHQKRKLNDIIHPTPTTKKKHISLNEYHQRKNGSHLSSSVPIGVSTISFDKQVIISPSVNKTDIQRSQVQSDDPISSVKLMKKSNLIDPSITRSSTATKKKVIWATKLVEVRLYEQDGHVDVHYSNNVNKKISMSKLDNVQEFHYLKQARTSPLNLIRIILPDSVKRQREINSIELKHQQERELTILQTIYVGIEQQPMSPDVYEIPSDDHYPKIMSLERQSDVIILD
ncbi:unnamed protein product [Didymodactylos carnosus]|uniref:Uncharacterized protein n=1 Tax=Didymodactylos carnosus TaxID=1234261 RepID=A0A8S2F8C0_9BILA|nr:unnamed protein product [Didymodactylos carnosus]CAF4192579.1 unnamed protein product [Didymodactylos carnosus]